MEGLIAPGVVNTMPAATLRAFADHGDVRRAFALDDGGRAAGETLSRAAAAGIDLAAVASELERDGVRAFRASYQEVLETVESKVRTAGGLTLTG